MSAEPVSTVLHISEREFLRHYADERPSYEYVNGEVTQKPMTKRTHVALAGELAALLREYRRRNAGAFSGEDPTINLSRSSDRRYRAPDVAYWSPEKVGDSEILPVPTLAVEIQSEGQSLATLRSKCREYRDRGVDMVWLIRPYRRIVEVFEGESDGLVLRPPEVLTSRVLGGLRVDLAELFAVLDG